MSTSKKLKFLINSLICYGIIQFSMSCSELGSKAQMVNPDAPSASVPNRGSVSVAHEAPTNLQSAQQMQESMDIRKGDLVDHIAKLINKANTREIPIKHINISKDETIYSTNTKYDLSFFVLNSNVLFQECLDLKHTGSKGSRTGRVKLSHRKLHIDLTKDGYSPCVLRLVLRFFYLLSSKRLHAFRENLLDLRDIKFTCKNFDGISALKAFQQISSTNYLYYPYPLVRYMFKGYSVCDCSEKDEPEEFVGDNDNLELERFNLKLERFNRLISRRETASRTASRYENLGYDHKEIEVLQLVDEILCHKKVLRQLASPKGYDIPLLSLFLDQVALIDHPYSPGSPGKINFDLIFSYSNYNLDIPREGTAHGFFQVKLDPNPKAEFYNLPKNVVDQVPYFQGFYNTGMKINQVLGRQYIDLSQEQFSCEVMKHVFDWYKYKDTPYLRIYWASQVGAYLNRDPQYECEEQYFYELQRFADYLNISDFQGCKFIKTLSKLFDWLQHYRGYTHNLYGCLFMPLWDWQFVSSLSESEMDQLYPLAGLLPIEDFKQYIENVKTANLMKLGTDE